MDLSSYEILICSIPVLAIIIFIVAYLTLRNKYKKPGISGSNPQPDHSSIAETSIDAQNSILHPSTSNSASSTNSLAIISLLFGVLAVAVHFIFGPAWGSCIGTMAIIFGLIAILQLIKPGRKGKLLAFLGIFLGVLPFLITLLTTLLLAFSKTNSGS